MKTFFFILATFLIVLIACLPKILSTSLGKPLFEKVLSQKFDASISIGKLRLTWFGPQSLQQITIASEQINGSIDALESNVPLWQLGHFGDAFLLKQGTFSFSPLNGSLTEVNGQIAGRTIHFTGNASGGGHFQISGKIDGKQQFDLAFDCKGIPSPLLDQIVHVYRDPLGFVNFGGPQSGSGFDDREESHIAAIWPTRDRQKMGRSDGRKNSQDLTGRGIELSAALGPTFDLVGSVFYSEKQGKMECDLSSNYAKLSGKGEIAHNALLLTRPLKCSLAFSPELGRALQTKMPFTLIGAKNPFLLTIDPTGTSIPLFPFSMDQLEIGSAKLDLGQILCEGMPSIVSFLAILHRSAPSPIPIWFTPVSFSIDHGILQMGRIDALLANAVHACAWGRVDLPSQTLDMTLGIPADTLAGSLGINNLSRNYVVKIPVRGSLQNPEFSTGPAAAKIAQMLAGQQLTKKTGVFGNILDKINPLTGDDGDAPPPNRPFPWER